MPTFKERMEAVKSSPEWPRIQYASQQKKRCLLIFVIPLLISVYLIEKYVGINLIYLAPAAAILGATIWAEVKTHKKFGPYKKP